MTRNRTLAVVASAALLLTLFVVLPSIGAEEREKEKRESVYRPLGLFTEVLSLVRGNYVEPVDSKQLMAGAFSGMTEAMDPFSEYIPPEKMAAFTAYQAARSKDAPELGIVLARRFGYPVVIATIAGSPAAAAGVVSDDLVEKIDGQSARGLAIWEVEARLSGKPGTRVRLLVVRDGKPRRRTIDIVSSSWTPQPPSAARVEGETVIRIPSFAPGTAPEIKALLAPLDRTKPLALDLRSNAWGTFEEAARAAALFVPAGPLGEMKGKKIEARSFGAEPGERVHESRLVLLVDSGTAGPAEFFAAAVQETLNKTPAKVAAKGTKPGETVVPPAPGDEETDAAEEGAAPLSWNGKVVRLVGEPSVGMGFTQQIVKMQSGGSLRVSVGKIRTPSGKALSPKGLSPDDRVYHVPPDDSIAQPPTDPFLDRAVKVLAEARPKAAA
ncbi:MAG TPA: S41 family peptidase [Thermoanaerobaculia bacterium]|nr:S41 family peptidase [Thermoanaerobaculia bacterium]